MEEKVIPQILCEYLNCMGKVTFMPETWREDCGAVFLTGEISGGEEYADGSSLAAVGFEVAVRCGGTSVKDRLDAVALLNRVGEYLMSTAITVNGSTGYVYPVSGAKKTEVHKNGVEEYRARYLLKYCRYRTIANTDAASVSRLYYINVGAEDEPVWKPIGEGFARFDAESSPVIYSRRYYHETDARTAVGGYAPQISFEVDSYSRSAAAEKLRGICEIEAVGGDAEVDIVTVLGGESEMPGVSRALRRKYTVVADRLVKRPKSLCHAGRLMAAGQTAAGRFVRSTGTFVSD